MFKTSVKSYRLTPVPVGGSIQLLVTFAQIGGWAGPATRRVVNVGSANGRKDAGPNRDTVAKMMSSADVSEAQRRAKLCMGSNYKDCD